MNSSSCASSKSASKGLVISLSSEQLAGLHPQLITSLLQAQRSFTSAPSSTPITVDTNTQQMPAVVTTAKLRRSSSSRSSTPCAQGPVVPGPSAAPWVDGLPLKVATGGAIQCDLVVGVEHSIAKADDENEEMGEVDHKRSRGPNWGKNETLALIDAITPDYEKLTDKNISNVEKGNVWEKTRKVVTCR